MIPAFCSTHDRTKPANSIRRFDITERKDIASRKSRNKIPFYQMAQSLIPQVINKQKAGFAIAVQEGSVDWSVWLNVEHCTAERIQVLDATSVQRSFSDASRLKVMVLNVLEFVSVSAT